AQGKHFSHSLDPELEFSLPPHAEKSSRLHLFCQLLWTTTPYYNGIRLSSALFVIKPQKGF
ncbi:MAG: hypothetical protein O4803_09545, partial [Trichodesmium sp. St15_bin1_1]|nr:hypothetical protein [Trichodesmium sp. St15_bin1_1]